MADAGACEVAAPARSQERLLRSGRGLHADLRLVGEAPGETEDREGRPFRGRAGRCFDEMLGILGRSREEI